jgi:sporulation protein YlmC with PRC-barrel domain
MIDQASVPSLMGSTVRDSAGDKIGKVGQVYLDDTTGQPEWVTVRTGLFGTKESFVPLAAARVEGDELVVDIPKSRVSDAPRVDEDGHLSEEQETELYTYYGVSQGPFGRQTTPTEGGAPDEGPVADTYAGTEAGRTGEGYPETDAGADYATRDAATAAAGTGYAGGDPTGTPEGDQEVAEAMSGVGYVEPGPEVGGEAGPDFARGEDGSVTGGVRTGPDFARGQDDSVTGEVGTGAAGVGAVGTGPDFARGEDSSVTGGQSPAGPDFARGTDRASRAGGVTDESFTDRTAGTDDTAGAPGGVRRRLRRWKVSDERVDAPVVDDSGEVVGEVRAERVDVRPADEDETR